MSDAPDDDDVGYRKPPKATRWKTGQSGNPRKSKPKRAESVLTVIKRLLVAPVTIVKNGAHTKMSALEAILHQLLQKSLSGDKKALRTLREFEEFAHRNGTAQFEIVFVDNEYTKALAASRLGEGNV
jgi:hypothetical protein